MAVIIALTNQKGGVGKTTTTTALVAGLVRSNKRVLSIDLDPQGNLGFHLGFNIEDGQGIYEVLKGSVDIKDAIKTTENYGDVLTSNISLSEAETTLKGEERQKLLQKALEPVKSNYDYIIIDTPPALNILTVNSYVSADYLIIPMASEILSLVGVSQIKDTIEAVRANLNPNLKILGILLTRYNARTNLSKEIEEMASSVASQIGTEIFKSKIRTGIAVAESPAHGQSVIDYSPHSKVAIDYRDFITEVMNKI